MYLPPLPYERPTSSTARDAGFLVSVVLHVLLVTSLVTYTAPPKPRDIFSVEVVPAALLSKSIIEQHQQLVSPSDRSDELLAPRDTNLESEKDSTVQKEMVRRGEALPPSRNANGNHSATQSLPISKAPVSAEPPPRRPLQTLLLADKDALREFSIKESEQNNLRDNLPTNAFSRPVGSGAAFHGSLGQIGISDHLPHLPDGDLTFLNAKANRHAVFVRRVATQVFAEMRVKGWEKLFSRDISNATGIVTVRAKLSPQGNLLQVTRQTSSGSEKFDAILNESVKVGARDSNPPSGAVASDGNIYFIFQSRSWVRFGAPGRNGAPQEERWLLLGTGLE